MPKGSRLAYCGIQTAFVFLILTTMQIEQGAVLTLYNQPSHPLGTFFQGV